MSSDGPQAQISAAQATALAQTLDHLQRWLLHGDPGAPQTPAPSWRRDLRADLRHHSSILRQAARAAAPGTSHGQGNQPHE
jgi:hypothetical protein